MDKLVSIITPCYNGERFVGRFLDSVLAQTYSNIELIIINDGSKDTTEQIILSYKHRFNKKGYSLKYIRQENGGQSSAINRGLKCFQGDYLTWPDSDDLLTPDAIEKKVLYMEDNPDKGLVICRTSVVLETTGKEIKIFSRRRPKGRDNLFEDLILDNNVYYSPGGYFVRSSMFREAMPDPIEIETSREIGQNFQLLLPLSYKYPCGYIDDILYIYMVRENSHSHTPHPIERRQKAIEISISVIDNIFNYLLKSNEDRKYFQRLLDIRYAKCNINLLAEYGVKDDINKYLQILKDNSAYDLNTRLKVLSIDSAFWRRISILKEKWFG